MCECVCLNLTNFKTKNYKRWCGRRRHHHRCWCRACLSIHTFIERYNQKSECISITIMISGASAHEKNDQITFSVAHTPRTKNTSINIFFFHSFSNICLLYVSSNGVSFLHGPSVCRQS